MSRAHLLWRLAIESAVACLTVGAAAAGASAATFTVTKTADTADGACTVSNCSLRDAITAANAAGGGNTVILPAGHYVLSIPGTNETANATGDLDQAANTNLTITGAGARTTIVDGNGVDRVFHVVGGPTTAETLTMSGLTVTGGMVHTTNTDYEGGGILGDTNATIVLTDVNVSGNQAEHGGGIFAGGALTLDRVLVSDNRAVPLATQAGEGAGIDAFSGPSTLTNVTITGNQAQEGFSGGSDGGGAGLANATLTNVTIAGNQITASSTGEGGGLEGDTSVTAYDTIVAGNLAGTTSDNCSVSLNSASTYDLEGGSSCGFTHTGDLQNANPMLGALQDNGGPTDTLALSSGSPAINAGSNSTCASVDQRGVTRPQPAGGTCDIGAFELAPAASPPPPIGTPPPPPPVNTAPPTISGTPLPGKALGCSKGSWSNAPTSFAYGWRRSGGTITGAASSRYKVQTLDRGAVLQCTVTATNSAGSRSATSKGVLVALPGTLRCRRPFGRVGGVQVGPFRLGMPRRHARQILRPWHLSYYGLDNYCLYAGWGIRVGYPSKALLTHLSPRTAARFTGRIILALTANPYYALDGVTPGMRVAAVAKRLHLGRPFHIGANYWYFAPGRKANGVLKVRAGIIDEVGLAPKALTTGRRNQRRFMGSFGAG